jgi:hypothetical protein
MTCQVVPITDVPDSNLHLLGVVRPILADVLLLRLQQFHCGIELFGRQRIGVLDAQLGLGLHQVQRGVGDVDRRVVGGDLALVVTARNTAPQESGAPLTTSVLYINRFAPQPCGMPYIWPSTEFHARSLRNEEMVA